MTPLFQKLIKQLTLPKKARSIYDPAGILQKLDDVHCFECSEVVEAACDLTCGDSKELGPNLAKLKQAVAVTGFLPAPKTWIEFVTPWEPELREGILASEIVGTDGTKAAEVFFAAESKGELSSAPCVAVYPLRDQAKAASHIGLKFLVGNLDEPSKNGFETIATSNYTKFVGLLAMINTPRIIGRHQHMPHRGLERKLARSGAGKYPLHAWSEILLRVTPTEVGDGEHEAHLTGARALHFCRAHLRIRLGRLEIVSSHWRGDPALGIKQARYRLAPKKVSA